MDQHKATALAASHASEILSAVLPPVILNAVALAQIQQAEEQAMDENTLGKRLLVTAGWLLVHFGAAVVLLFVLVKVVPHFEKVFADFSLELPVFTEVLIGLSRFTCAFWWLIVPAGLLDAGVLLGLRSLPRGARRLSTMWATVVLLGVILLLGAAILAVGLPLAGLTHALASSSAP
jgi:hypothetical protein